MCSPDLSIGDFLETDAGFVWVEVACVYSCYFSSLLITASVNLA